MRVAHFGTFDVENYGDLLFPVVAKYFLAPISPEFTFVSPLGGGPVCEGAETTVGVLDMAWNNFDFDLALIGGGNIVSARPTSLPVYTARQGLGLVAYPSLWASACMRASQIGAAVAWNAPGLQQEKWSASQRRVLRGCLKYSDYVSFREADFISRTIQDNDLYKIVPDPVIALAMVWSADELDPYKSANVSKWGLESGYFVFHAKKRNLSTPKSQREAVVQIGEFAKRTGLKPLLLAIGRCHGDHEILQMLSDALIVDHVLVDSSIHLKATTALIASAEYVFTASLHCAIVAGAYGRPVTLLGIQALPKYLAFFKGHLDADDVVVSSTTSLSTETFDAAKQRQSMLKGNVNRACEIVIQHYRQIIAASETGKSRESASKALNDHLAAARKVSPIANVLPIETLL